MPQVRAVARDFRRLPIGGVRSLLRSKYHEERSLALIVLAWQFERGDEDVQASLYRFYLDNLRWVNNWDLVDGSAGQIVGCWLIERDKGVLYRLARSRNLWERRVAIISTSYFIGKHRFEDALKISAMLLEDREDLIHKAVGWMLREIWKREAPLAEAFMEKHHESMPRTMVRYAIEQFPREKRARFLLKSRRQKLG
jgi:3-methyladenine DNA glycosylase AlkD